MRSASIWKNLAISTSLSCLALLGVFKRLLFPTGDRYFEKELPTLEMGAALICVGLIAAIFLIVLTIRKKIGEGRVKIEVDILFFGLGLLCFGALSAELITWWSPLTYEHIYFQMPLTVGLLCLLIPRKTIGFAARAAENLRGLALILFPLAVLMCLNTIFQMTGMSNGEMGPSQVRKEIAAIQTTKFPKRVVWMIFDELDQEAIKDRPPHIEMDSLENLSARSVVAENAFPPNNWTLKSIPSLLTGRQVVQAHPTGTKDLEIRFSKNGPAENLGRTENIFSDVKAMGGRSGVVGWYHPYSRLFSEDVQIADWYQDAVSTCFSMRECVSQTLAIAFNSLPFSNPFEERKQFKFQELFSEGHVAGQAARIPEMRRLAFDLVLDGGLDLVYLHFSFPHAPYFDKNTHQTDDYLVSLELVDETIGEIIRKLKEKGLDGRTAIIVSSDHWWRLKTESGKAVDESQLRVPFVVHAGGDVPVALKQPFNTILTRYLINAILLGEVTSNDDVQTWIDRFVEEHPELANARPDPNEQWMIAEPR